MMKVARGRGIVAPLATDQLRKEVAMTEQEALERITVNPGIFAGKPIIRGMRIAVDHVLGMLAAGDTPERILSEYPFLETEDIQACLAYAESNPLHVH